MPKGHKIEKSTGTLAEVLSGAFMDIEMLKDEMGDWQSNMEGTNLENTSKYEMVTEAVDGLGQIDEVEIPASLSERLANIEITFSVLTPYKGRYLSRGTRLSNAGAALEAVMEKLQELIDKDDETILAGKAELQEQRDEIESLLQEIENAKDNAESVEFPGMY